MISPHISWTEANKSNSSFWYLYSPLPHSVLWRLLIVLYSTSSSLSNSHYRASRVVVWKSDPQTWELARKANFFALLQTYWNRHSGNRVQQFVFEQTLQVILKHSKLWESLFQSITFLPLFKYIPHSKLMPFCYTILYLSWTVSSTIFTFTHIQGLHLDFQVILTLGDFRVQGTKHPMP